MSDEQFKHEYLGEFPEDKILKALKRAYVSVADKDHNLFLAQVIIKNGIDSIKNGAKTDEVVRAILESMGELINHLHKQLVKIQSVTVEPIVMTDKPTRPREWDLETGINPDGTKSITAFGPEISMGDTVRTIDISAYDSALAAIGKLREALSLFAKIEAEDGDNFDGVHEDVIIRVEVTAGDIHSARDALAATSEFETEKFGEDE